MTCEHTVLRKRQRNIFQSFNHYIVGLCNVLSPLEVGTVGTHPVQLALLVQMEQWEILRWNGGKYWDGIVGNTEEWEQLEGGRSGFLWKKRLTHSHWHMSPVAATQFKSCKSMLMQLSTRTDTIKLDGAVRLLNVFGVFLKIRGDLEDNWTYPLHFALCTFNCFKTIFSIDNPKWLTWSFL